MDSVITRAEHEEFAKRMDADHKRFDKRITLLEDAVDKTQSIAISVEKLALSVENMSKEIGKQGVRLEAIEGRDGEMWRKVVGYAITAVVGILVGFVFTKLGFN